MAIRFPLDRTAVGQADDVFYCQREGDADLFTSGGSRIPLKRGDPRCSEWCDLYEQIVAHNADGSEPFPDCGKGHEHHPSDCPHCKASTDPVAPAPVTPDPPEPSPDPPAPDPVEPCPDPEYALVELIEVVERDEEMWVEGPCKAAVDHARAKSGIARTDAIGSTYRQFINLGQDPEGQPKRRPDYGRKLLFRARVERSDGAKDALGGHKVNFTFARTDGPNRTDPSGEPAVWDATDLTGAQREGFNAEGGDKEASASTEADGWTGQVAFHLSQFGGDAFTVTATLDKSVRGAAASAPIASTAYQGWRRFWYQLSHATGFAAVQPTAGEAAYAEVFADMSHANTRTFAKADFPADLQDRTFNREFQFKAGGGTAVVCNIGTGNVDEFYTNPKLMLVKQPDQPLKDIAIACEYQIDPEGTTALLEETLTSASKTVTLAGGTNGIEIVSDPPVGPGLDLVAHGEYATTKTPWTPLGTLGEADVTVEQARTTTMDVKITLPAGAPTPTAAAPVHVRLQVEGGSSYLGWAPSKGGVVAVYVPGTKAEDPKSEEDFNDTVAHEFAHQFNLPPREGTAEPSLKDHPHQYVGHGGSGSHCRHGATVAPGPVDWQDASEDTPVPDDGDCLVYHQYSDDCAHVFCPICKPHAQLNRMDKFGK